VAGSCELGNELLGFIKGRKFLDYLCDYELLGNQVNENVVSESVY
jgi:hypothetical protein